MLDSQQKRKVKAVAYHKATLAILFILVLFTLRANWVVYQKKAESEKLKSISLNNENGLAQRQAELNAQIERLQTASGVEAEIRSKFSVAKEKENVVVIVYDNSVPKPATTTESFWQKFLDLFKN